jgi:hypothetical protein
MAIERYKIEPKVEALAVEVLPGLTSPWDHRIDRPAGCRVMVFVISYALQVLSRFTL